MSLSCGLVSSLSDLVSFLPEVAPLWVVDVDRQRLLAVENGEILEETPVSTSRFGFGNCPNSLQTPLGWHKVTEVLGKGAPAGQRFVSRKPVAEVLQVWTGGEGDAILSRVLPLTGLVQGLNENSLSRHIYLHGTHQEELLGQPASHGCIRVGNEVLIRWTDCLQALPYVWIGSLSLSRP